MISAFQDQSPTYMNEGSSGGPKRWPDLRVLTFACLSMPSEDEPRLDEARPGIGDSDLVS